MYRCNSAIGMLPQFYLQIIGGLKNEVNFKNTA